MRNATLAAAAFLLLVPPAISQEVTLPLEDYESLRRRANPDPPPEIEPAVPFSLETAVIEIDVGDDSVVVRQQLTLSIYDEGWHSVPLADAGSLTSIELGELEGRLTTAEGNVLVARGMGRHAIAVSSVVPLVEDPVAARPTRTLELELPRAGLVTGVVSTGLDVELVEILEGGLQRSTSDADAFEFVGSPGTRLSLRLLGADRAPDQAGLPLRFEARSATMVELSRTALTARARVNVDVLQGTLEVLRLTVPDGLEVARVDAGESGWRMEGGNLVITLAEPALDRFFTQVVLSGDHTSAFTAPLLVPESAERSFLVTGLKVEADGIPIVEDVGASRRATELELGALASPGARAFVVRDPARPPRWSIEWSDSAQNDVLAAQADRIVVDTLIGDAGRAAYQFWIMIRSTGAPSVTIEPPSGFELSGATRDGAELTPGLHDDGRLEIPLVAGAAVQTIRVTGVIPFEPPVADTEFEVPVPSLSVPVGRAEVRAVVRSDRRYSAVAKHVDHAISTVPAPFWVPDGFHAVEAGWTALSPRPKPLVLTSKREKSKPKWY